MRNDTIFALSSAPGRAGVAVLRISGPATASVIENLTGRTCPPPRQASLRRFLGAQGQIIDRGLLLWFPSPDSFTGEDLAEFHVHGGRAVVQGLLDSFSQQASCRIALAGEFTRRAFDAGKLDLAEVEGLADLIAADTEAQRGQALRQLEGGLSGAVADWTSELTALLAHVEAEIEFPDEDIGETLSSEKLDIIAEAERKIAGALTDCGFGERLREGFSAVLLGAPNVGKSSLMNCLAQRDVAIVSEEAGTTRDVIEVSLDLAGYPLTLADTAGLRCTAETDLITPVEAEGMRRTRKRAEEADLRVLVVDATIPNTLVDERQATDSGVLLVANKRDLLEGPLCQSLQVRDAIEVSAKTGEGVDALIATLRDRLSELADVGGEAPIVTRARHRQALEDCRAALARAVIARSLELVAEDLRLALRALGRIVGRVDVEDVLDVVFRDFCIGK